MHLLVDLAGGQACMLHGAATPALAVASPGPHLPLRPEVQRGCLLLLLLLHILACHHHLLPLRPFQARRRDGHGEVHAQRHVVGDAHHV